MVIALVQQIFSLFLMLGMGVLLVRFGGVRAEESRTLSALCIYVVTPCVIIHAFQIEYTRETMQGFILAILLAAAAHLLMFLISFVLQKPLQLTQVESLSIVYPNSGNLVIPLVAVILGSEWVIYASAFMSVQLFCIWTHGLSVISRQRKFDLQKILTNVNLLCVAGGFLLFLFQIKLPKVIDDTLASVSGMMGPVSMIMIGMMMAGICLTPILKNRRIYFVAALRLIAIPLAAMLLLWPVKHALTAANAPQILLIILLALIMPPSSTVTQLAQLYQNDADYCGSINVLATLLSIATMPVMIALWEHLP